MSFEHLDYRQVISLPGVIRSHSCFDKIWFPGFWPSRFKDRFSATGQNLFSRDRCKQVHQAGYDARPTGLMAGTETGAIVTVEIFKEREVVSPVGSFWNFHSLRTPVVAPSRLKEHPRETGGDLPGDFIKRHLVS